MRIETDEGINGLGECFFAPGLTCILRSLEPVVHGEDPRDIHRLFRKLQLAVSGAGSVAGIMPAVESPRWLMKMGRRDEAIGVLVKINGADVARRETVQFEDSLAIEEGHISELFTTFRRPLLLGIMLTGLQQISGITPLFSFLPEIFRAAGTATSDAFPQSVLVSLINLVFTLFALWLVDRAGHKTLILAGTTVQFVSFRLVGWFYHIHGSGVAVPICVMSFVAGHAFGNGVARRRKMLHWQTWAGNHRGP